MQVRLFAAAFFVGVLVMSQSLQPRQAQAWCCGCSCMYYCTCSGYYDRDQKGYCWYCRSTEPVLQTKAPSDEMMDNLRSVNESRASSTLRSDVLQRLTQLRALSPCLRDKIALSLLGDNQESMKFELVRFDAKNVQQQTVALQVHR